MKKENYIGELKNGKKHGYGILTLSDERKYIGKFTNDVLNGFGMIIQNDCTYFGNIKDGNFDSGIKVEEDKDVYGIVSINNVPRRYILRIGNLDYFYMGNKILFIDIKTTGLPKNWNSSYEDIDNWPRLVQLSYMLYFGEKLYCKESFVIKPDNYEITIESTKIHGVTNRFAEENGVDIEIVLEKLLKIVDISDFVVANNFDFSKKVIESEVCRIDFHSLIFDFKESFCLMKDTKKVLSEIYEYNGTWPNLKKLHEIIFNRKIMENDNSENHINIIKDCYMELTRYMSIGIEKSLQINYFNKEY